MSIEIKKVDDFVEISVTSSALTIELATELKEKFLTYFESGETNFRLNLPETRYIDSSGIGKLLFFNKKIASVSGKFEIGEINSELYDFIDSLAITKVIQVSKPLA
ncbi:MAG: STAS domain-containing protein [Spirochaetales bacterium]|nr:STAS domain-containing protein [Spirochaetales bacterium]